MSDLISRKEFLKRIEPYNTEDKMGKALYNFAYNRMMDCSSSEPERKPGKWIENGIIRQCNMCRALYSKGQRCGAYHYCPNCGAKMEV